MAKVVKKTGDELIPTGDDTKKIAEAIKIQKQIEKKTEELAKLKSDLSPIIEYFDEKLTHGATISTKVGSVEKKVTNSYGFKESMYPDMQKLFGAEVGNFVTIKTSYGVTAKLKELLKDVKAKQWKIASKAVIVTSSSSVKFKSK